MRDRTTDLVELSAQRGLSPRQARLLTLDAVVQGTVYSELVPWDRDEDESGKYVRARLRQPSVQAGLAGQAVQRLLDKLVGSRTFCALVLDEGKEGADANRLTEALWDEIDIAEAMHLPVYDLITKGCGCIGFAKPAAAPSWEAVLIRPEWADAIFVSQVKGPRARAIAAELSELGVDVPSDEDGPHLEAPEGATSLDLAFLRHQWRVDEELPIAKGAIATRTQVTWYRRDYLPNAILEYRPFVLASETQAPGDFELLPVEPHNWGAIPLVWLTPQGTEPGQMDGPSLLSPPVRSICEAADYNESFTDAAQRVNSAPRLNEIDVEDAVVGLDVTSGYGGRTNHRPSDAGAVGQYRSRGPSPSVALLETSGVAVQRGTERGQHYAARVAALTGIVDYDQSQASGALSGEALKRLLDPLLSRVDGYRSRIEAALRLLVEKLARVMQKLGELKADVACEVEWPEIVELTAQDIQALAQALSVAKTGGLLSQETASTTFATRIGIADPEGEASKASADADDAMKKALDAMRQRPGQTPPQKPGQAPKPGQLEAQPDASKPDASKPEVL